VVTSQAPASYRLAHSHDFTFVLDGAAAAIERARTAAGSPDVFVMGGGALVGSGLRDGLLDELRLTVSPEVPGAGTPLFAGVGRRRLTQNSVEVSPVCIHLTYRWPAAEPPRVRARPASDRGGRGLFCASTVRSAIERRWAQGGR
jgi:dihydrofolate reductase